MTSSSWNGNLGGLSGADQKCQEAADVAGLGGTWVAWLSDSTHNARDRITHTNYGYYLINGTKIADNFSDLVDGCIDHFINLDENGNVVRYDTIATGSNEYGYKVSNNCNDWTSPSSSLDAELGENYESLCLWTSGGGTF